MEEGHPRSIETKSASSQVGLLVVVQPPLLVPPSPSGCLSVREETLEPAGKGQE